MSHVVLQLKGVRAGYGKKQVIHGVDIALRKGTVTLVLGHNGAGKTTLFRTVFGLQRAMGGTILHNGQPMGTRTPGQNVDAGVAFVPQGHGVFRTLSVRENLELGAFAEKHASRAAEQFELTCTLFPILKERMKQIAGTMSGGQQQMLAIGMALMHRPEILILDEPTIGLAPNIVERVIESVSTINQKLGTSIIFAEQNIQASLRIADEVVILKTGETVYCGAPDPLREQSNLMKYF